MAAHTSAKLAYLSMPFSKSKTPKLANWLASKFINDNYLEEFYGDLQEIYNDRLAASGQFYARLMYWIDALHLMKGFTSTGLFKTQNNNNMLVRNMFKIAFRNALRQKRLPSLI